jgi:hypothetical protein
MHQTGCLKLFSKEPDIRIIDSRRKRKAKINGLKRKAEIKRLNLEVKNGKKCRITAADLKTEAEGSEKQ